MLPAADVFLISVARACSAAIATGLAVAFLVRGELLTLLPAAVSAENGKVPVFPAAADKAQAIALLVRNDPSNVLSVVYPATDSYTSSLAASVSCVPHLRPRLYARMAFRRAGSDFRRARLKENLVEMDVVGGGGGDGLGSETWRPLLEVQLLLRNILVSELGVRAWIQ